MDSIQNCDNYINIPSSQTCWSFGKLKLAFYKTYMEWLIMYKMFSRKYKQQDRDQIWDISCPLFQGGNNAMRMLLNKVER
jgi:hypothetical protein